MQIVKEEKTAIFEKHKYYIIYILIIIYYRVVTT